MAKKNDTMGKTFTVIILLCLVCSIVVAGSAVGLRDRQEANAALAMQRNVLIAAGIEVQGRDVEALYAERVREFMLDMETYELIQAGEEELAAAANITDQGETSRRLSQQEDIAGIRSLERRMMFYVVHGENGEEVQAYVLPMYGAGLWGLMWGLFALESDGMTIAGLNFYEHAETAGLGGEIQNPRWVNEFVGKQAVSANGDVQIHVTKGANPERNEVDALSGATITSNGVDNILQFWLSDAAYGPFLARLREGEIQ